MKKKKKKKKKKIKIIKEKYDNEINNLKNEIETLNLNLNNLKTKNEEQDKENIKLINLNKEISEKLKVIKTDEELIKERDNYKILYEK